MATLARFAAWIARLDAVYAEQKDYLTDLDAAIGDADHGINMARGFAAAHQAIVAAPPADVGALLKAVAMTLIRTVGGASGPLYGTFFLRAAPVAGAVAEVDAAGVEALFAAGAAGIAERGKAVVGDKTMIDAWGPAVEALGASRAAGGAVADMLAAAAAAAAAGRDATLPLVARTGRASYLGERSRGHIDPGAASTALLLAAAHETLG